MAAEIINQFDLKRKLPLLTKERVADQTARLALKYVYKGLITRQSDTDQRFIYIGNETSNLAADWELIQKLHTGTSAPTSTLGSLGDIHINETTRVVSKKVTISAWSELFAISGAQIFTGTGVPSNSDGLNGDMYFRSNGDVYRKESGAWALKFNIAGEDGEDGDTYATTSTTSINLATATAPLNLTTVDLGLDYTAGQSVVVTSRADNANKVTGDVVSYNAGTGALVLNNLTIDGTGTHVDWDVNLSGAPGATGPQGKAFIHTESDITLTQAKIVAVQGGSWTPENPWSASVLNDTRSAGELTSTAGIVGNKAGYSIAYNGTSWFTNGIWRGPKGDQGNTGAPGAPGAIITNNYLPFEYLTVNLIENKTRSVIVNRIPAVPSAFTLGGKCEVGTIIVLESAGFTCTVSTNANASILASGGLATVPANTVNALTLGQSELYLRFVFICVTKTGDNNVWEVLSADKQYVFNSLTHTIPVNPNYRIKEVAGEIIGDRLGKSYASHAVGWTNPATTKEEANKFCARIEATFYAAKGTTDNGEFLAYLVSDDNDAGAYSQITTSRTWYSVGTEYQFFVFTFLDFSVPAGTKRYYRFELIAQGSNTSMAINVSSQARVELITCRK